MSLASDINKYIQMLEYLDKKCGEAIGVNKQMEGAIGPNDAVSNTRQAITQSSHMVQPYFELHNIIKGNVLRILLETAKVAYTNSNKKKLSYVLDDLSAQLLNIDNELLDNSTYGLFISNSSKAQDAKDMVQQLAHAALQNQRVELSDLIKVIRSESIQQAEELLEVAQQKKTEQEQAMQKAQLEQQQKMQESQQQHEKDTWEHEEKMIVLKEEERRKTEIQKQTMFSLGFSENKDEDEDGVPDIMEVAKFGVDAEIKKNKQQLERDKFEHQKIIDNEKIKIDKKKVQKVNLKKG